MSRTATIAAILVFLLAIALRLSGWTHFLSQHPNRPPSTPFELSDDPNLVFGRLQNNFRYMLLKNPYPEDRIVLRLHVDVGAGCETENEQGIAHFLEHIAFRRSRHFPQGDIIEQMQKHGLAFGSHLNAATSFFNTVYKLDLPHNDTATVDVAFSAFRDFCDGLIISQVDVDQERGVVLSEKRESKGVYQRLTKKRRKFLFEGTLLADRMTIGKTKVITNATSETLRNFYEKWYSPEKFTFVAVGNIDTAEFEERIRNAFEDLKSKNPPVFEIGRLKVEQRKFFYFSAPELSSTSVEIRLVFPNPFVNDTYDARRYERILIILASVLEERLQDQKLANPLLFTGAGTDLQEISKKVNYISFVTSISCEIEHWEACLNLLEQELRRLFEYGISEIELQRQHAILLDAAERGLLASKTRHSVCLASRILDKIVDNTFLLSPERSLELVKRYNLDITTKDCLDVFRKIWGNFYVYVRSNGKIDGAEQTIEKVFNESAKMPVPSNKDDVTYKFPYETFQTPFRAIVNRTYIEDLDITQLTLANQVKVNLKPTKFTEDEIQFALAVGHGRATDYPGVHHGLFVVTELFLARTGLQKYPWRTLSKFLTSRGISLDVEINQRSFLVSGQSDQKNLLVILQLLIVYLTDLGFEERALIDAREDLKPKYETRGKSIEDVTDDQYQKFITGNDSISGLPDETRTLSVEIDDIKELLLSVFEKEDKELTIVGDFDLEQVINNIQDTFGALPLPSPSQNTMFDSETAHFPKNITEKSFHYTGDEKVTLYLLTFLTDDVYNIRDSRLLAALGEIVTDRLRDKMRKTEGKCYSPRVSRVRSPFKHFGLFQIALYIDPGSIEEIRNATLAIIADLKAMPISEEEVERVRVPLLHAIRDSRKTNHHWVSRITYAHRYPSHLDMLRSVRSFFQNVTGQMLQETAQKYLHDPVHVTISRKESDVSQNTTKV
jgi:zinc protease